MVLFANPWALSSYRTADILLWVAAIVAAVAAFFLLMEFFKTKKTHHLLWGLALMMAYIIFHQVAMNGSYHDFLTTMMAAMLTLIPGLIATGLIYTTFEDRKFKDKIKYGELYLIFLLIMSFLIVWSRTNYLDTDVLWWEEISFRGSVTYEAVEELTGFRNALGLDIFSALWVPILLSLFSLIPSMILIVGLPIYTTKKLKETDRATSKGAYLVAVGGILFCLAALFLVLMAREMIILPYRHPASMSMVFIDGVPTPVMVPARDSDFGIISGTKMYLFDVATGLIMGGLVAYLILFSIPFFISGWLYEKRWSFEIPGIEFED
jgi:hypothetical protein